MPLYDYRCKQCGHAFEELVRTMPGPSVLECPNCGQMTALRQLSTFSTRSRSSGGASTSSAGCGPATGG